jgi:hypothetical protein
MNLSEILRRRYPGQSWTVHENTYDSIQSSGTIPPLSELEALWPEVEQEIAAEKEAQEKAESLAEDMRKYYFSLPAAQRASYVSFLAELKAMAELGDLEAIGIRVRNLPVNGPEDEAAKSALVSLIESFGV